MGIIGGPVAATIDKMNEIILELLQLSLIDNQVLPPIGMYGMPTDGCMGTIGGRPGYDIIM